MRICAVITLCTILSVMIDLHLAAGVRRLWVQRTASIAQDDARDNIINYSDTPEKYISNEEAYFHHKHNSHLKSFTSQDNFFARRKQEQAFKVQHRWPLVSRFKRSLEKINTYIDKWKETISKKVPQKSSVVPLPLQYNERRIVRNDIISVDSYHLNDSVSVNSSEVKENSSHSIARKNTDLANITDLYNNTEFQNNGTLAERMQNSYKNMEDLELSDQPFNFHDSEIQPSCTTDCGIITEAESLCHSCHQVCHFIPGSSSGSTGQVKCGCYRGYAIGPDWLHCIDVDECSVNSWLCHGGTCLNTVGSFVCRCRPGYQLIGHMCIDVDECTKNKGVVGMCDQVCINVPGTYQCWCHKGFTISKTNPTSCVDINECENSVCSHSCTNTIGSFICTCPPSMRLHIDGRTCVLKSEVQGGNLGIDKSTKNIIIDGSRKIVIYGNTSADQLFGGAWPGAELEHQNTNSKNEHGTLLSPTHVLYTSSASTVSQSLTSWRFPPSAINRTSQSNIFHTARKESFKKYQVDKASHSARSIDLTNVSAAFSPQAEIVTLKIDDKNHMLIQKNHVTQGKSKTCVPACKNEGTCDEKRKCHCKEGFQGRYCQIDVNECSTTPFLCNYVCVNTFGSYQCLCPTGYKISDDRKSCFPEQHNYSAVIEVLVNPEKVNSRQTIQPSKPRVSRTHMKTTGYHRTKPHNRLAIENLHTLEVLESSRTEYVPVFSSLENELFLNEQKPTAALHGDLHMMDSTDKFIIKSEAPRSIIYDDILNTGVNFGGNFLTPTPVIVAPFSSDFENSADKIDGKIVNTVFNFIFGSEQSFIDISTLHHFFHSDIEPTKPVILKKSLSLSTHDSELFSPTVSIGSSIFVTPHSTNNLNISFDKADNTSEINSGNKEVKNNSLELKRDRKGKKTKKLNHKDDKQKSKTDKGKKLKNKTLKNGRLKLVRLSKDFQVLHQILDASRESWRMQGTNLPHVSRQRAETDWNMDTANEGKSGFGTEDRYFEVIDYDDEYIGDPLVPEDPFSPAPLTLPTSELPVWNESRRQELNCFYKKQIIKSRTSLYRDERNCTRCLCKDGELQCKPRHCPIPHCEAPLRGKCCDYCPNDCVIDNNVYLPGERFIPAVDPCRECRCKSGRAVCEDVRCRALDCPQQYQVFVPDECCPVCLPPEPGCFYKGRFFYQGQLWVRKEGGCQACLCKDGEVQCNPVLCVVDCQHPQFIPGECCPLCEGCQHYNRKYENQEKFPHPSDTCSMCQCQHGNITCYPKPCDVTCSHPYKPAGECCASCRHCYFNNRKISNGASLIINNGTCQECTCKQGNVTCKSGACAKDCIIRGKPIPSGAEFHIGSDTCTQCRCWNGTVSCHAVECLNICSHGVLLPHKCCLDCTKCDYQGQLYSEMQVFRPNDDNCKSCLCVKGNVMCQDTCRTSTIEH